VLTTSPRGFGPGRLDPARARAGWQRQLDRQPHPLRKRLNYLIEGSARTGNVGWLASGIEGSPSPRRRRWTCAHSSDRLPLPTDTFEVGDTIALTGSATDAQECDAPASALSWTVLLHQGGQAQTVFGPGLGGERLLDRRRRRASQRPWTAPWRSSSRRPTPWAYRHRPPAPRPRLRVPLTFATQPAGLTLMINGAARGRPPELHLLAGLPIDLAASSQTAPAGRATSSSLVDGGARPHLVTPASPTVDIAFFSSPVRPVPCPSSPCTLPDDRHAPVSGPMAVAPPRRPDCGLPFPGSAKIRRGRGHWRSRDRGQPDERRPSHRPSADQAATTTSISTSRRG